MLRDFIHLLQLLNIILKARLDTLLTEYSDSKLVNTLLFISPWKIFSTNKPRGERIKGALQEAGPIYIKFGQLLSTRPDVVPTDIARALQSLQDNLPSFSSKIAIEIIEEELGAPIHDLFDDFEDSPCAAASIAQVHLATLKGTDTEVAIKVVRPNIARKIARDISLMKRAARIIEKYSKDATRLQVLKLVEEYEYVIEAELNMRIEASNIKQTKRNFTDNKLLYVPEVYLDLTTDNVLVMEKISGIPVDKIETLKELGVDLKLLSERGVEIFLKQVFIDNFFHADMHPGNIFIEAEDPSNPSYIAVDYAIVGSLSEDEQFQIGRMLLAVISKNFSEVASVLIEAKWVDPHTRPNELERTIRAACEPIFDQPLENINFGELLLFIFDSARRFNLNMQPSLMLLQKTLINIEGLGKQLYPGLDFWSIANPFLKSWIAERYNPEKMQDWAKENAAQLIEKARKLPEVAETAIEQIKNIESYQRASESRHEELVKKISNEKRSLNLLTIIIIGSIIIYLFN